MSYYQCPKCGKTVHEDDFDHGVPEQCGACYQASSAVRLEVLKARVRAMSATEVQAFWKTLVKVGKSAEDLAFAAGYAEGLEASRAELDKVKAMYSEAANELFALKRGGVSVINGEAQRVAAMGGGS